jgi:hypothetical protein
MNGQQVFRLTELFFATVSLGSSARTGRWPMNQRAFALAIDSLKPKGNSLARDVPVYNSVAGRACHVFNEMLSTAMSAGFICYLSPEYSHFVSNLSVRGAERILKRADVSEVERREAMDLVEAYVLACVQGPLEQAPSSHPRS